MTAIELIIQLQKMPPNMEVFIDITPSLSDMFKFTECDSVELVEIPEFGNVVALGASGAFENTERNDING